MEDKQGTRRYKTGGKTKTVNENWKLRGLGRELLALRCLECIPFIYLVYAKRRYAEGHVRGVVDCERQGGRDWTPDKQLCRWRPRIARAEGTLSFNKLIKLMTMPRSPTPILPGRNTANSVYHSTSGGGVCALNREDPTSEQVG